MSEPTATEALGIYTGSHLEKPIDQYFPLIMPDRRLESTAHIVRLAIIYPLLMPERRPEATPATWVVPHEAVPIYEVDVSRRFQQLVGQWSKNTINMSSIAAKAAYPAYLEIISMGEKVVPLLLRELEKEPNHWFPALMAITGENPIPEEARGRFKEMTEAWLEWGRDNNYI